MTKAKIPKKVVNMEVTIFSRERIRPSSSLIGHMKPKKLCLFDQLTPITYPEVALFYSINDRNFDLNKTLIKLKKSLSETLTLFYPFSGKAKNNLHIEDYDNGVPYSEAKVNCRMSAYFQLRETESLNKFVSIHPFSKENDTSGPQLAIQVNVFTCGGIALGVSVCHKQSDGASLSYLLKSWAALFTDSPEKVIQPELSKAASFFPPRTELPSNCLALMDQLWFKKSNYVTKRFYFDSKAISTLKALAKSERVPSPTRNDAVSCFIWKHAMEASWAISGSPRTSIAAHAVNMRPRMKDPRSLENCTGNLFWWASIVVNPAQKDDLELSQLVALTKEMVAEFDGEYLDTLVGEAGFEPVSEFVEQLEMMISMESEKPDIFAFTNWKDIFNDVDFGWGSPVWVAAHGKVGSEFRNLIVLIDSQGSNVKEIEAFVTLEDQQMAVLESDSKFLAFAGNSNNISSCL
ncbi:stemmadenine O-acetyltransferase-like [Humulus lupulus]|uniref:stemmadenine O-acetyltransferase-like n=1 Tax=Humulus lupulus TaxID=3486 RepID=UPI002B40677E|nr:stemmadenine O-acetyltransferase-like [Humulus lupulus]